MIIWEVSEAPPLGRHLCSVLRLHRAGALSAGEAANVVAELITFGDAAGARETLVHARQHTAYL